ncbi:hypothetical protein V8E55_009411 [Tylopilus felleus]
MLREAKTVITSLEVREVNPWISRDIERAQHCEVDKMIKYFLLDCMDDSRSTMNDAAAIFETCLDRVLPVCNGDVSDSSKIRNNLENCYNAGKKSHLYPAFVRAANTALLCLQHLDKIDGLPDPSEKLVFHVNDREMKQSHEKFPLANPMLSYPTLTCKRSLPRNQQIFSNGEVSVLSSSSRLARSHLLPRVILRATTSSPVGVASTFPRNPSETTNRGWSLRRLISCRDLDVGNDFDLVDGY